MRITHGNTVLRSLEEEDLELVRNWRNDQLVNEHLLNREYISQEAQLEWFGSLVSEESLYLVAEEKGVPFGLIYATDINQEEGSYWGNIIVGESEFRNSHLPVKTVLMLMWYFFHELNFESCHSKVASANTSAVQLNMALGFELVSEADGIRIEQCCKAAFITTGMRLIEKVLRNEAPAVEYLNDQDKRFLLTRRIIKCLFRH